MKNGLLHPALLSFVFAPLVVTVALLPALWWKRMRDSRGEWDMPGLLLASAVGGMPDERRDWGAAMLAELGQLHGVILRWRFALGCVRAALFPPRGSGPLHQVGGHSPVCGMLAVALPPLGLPFIYFAAVVVEAIGGSPLTQTSRWSHPDAVIGVVKVIVVLTVGCLLAGLPLGLIGWLRRERLRWLSVMGMISSVCIMSYFMIVMHFTAGGPNGD